VITLGGLLGAFVVLRKTIRKTLLDRDLLDYP
jgi:hypothetical protein